MSETTFDARYLSRRHTLLRKEMSWARIIGFAALAVLGLTLATIVTFSDLLTPKAHAQTTHVMVNHQMMLVSDFCEQALIDWKGQAMPKDLNSLCG